MAKESKRPAFDVIIPSTEDRNVRPDAVYWTKIGVAFPRENEEGYVIKLNAHPIGRTVVLAPYETKEEREARQSGQE